jgi:hypothetical protein
MKNREMGSGKFVNNIRKDNTQKTDNIQGKILCIEPITDKKGKHSTREKQVDLDVGKQSLKLQTDISYLNLIKTRYDKLKVENKKLFLEKLKEILNRHYDI